MGHFEKINQVLRSIDEQYPAFFDTLNDDAINEIREVKKIRKNWRIVNFKVIRDNDIEQLADGSISNKGGNRLIDFEYELVPEI